MAEERMLASNKTENTTFPKANGDEWPMGPFCPDTSPEPPQGRKWPKISIVTPSFNQGLYLEKTIRSVLLQGYPNLEYIIIDGGSTDGSVEIIKKYEPWIDFWVSEKDRGQSHAINKGLSRASAELLGWLNSDDYYLPGALFKVAKAYLIHPSFGAYYGQGSVVNEKKETIYTPKLTQVTRESLFEWSFGKNFMQPSCLFTREAWEDCGPLDENIHIALDVDLWLKIAGKYSFKQIDELLSISLSHPNAKTTAYKNHMLVDLSLVLLKHGGESQARRTMEKICNRLIDCENKLTNMKEAEKKRCGYIFKKVLSFLRRKLFE